ncbi:hypothetical protein MTR67_013278 [Solanum verrucosum]|uniref:Uncharacterized protein n=1 Tax=Solanum verrucosum TaxID=315347 RepID=A0AAF0QC68_SOLVR|nr:hypothetical protein MTR67_013278 [Solanum verrucosum]
MLSRRRKLRNPWLCFFLHPLSHRRNSLTYHSYPLHSLHMPLSRPARGCSSLSRAAVTTFSSRSGPNL